MLGCFVVRWIREAQRLAPYLCKSWELQVRQVMGLLVYHTWFKSQSRLQITGHECAHERAGLVKR